MLRKISATFVAMSAVLTGFSQDSATVVSPKLTVTGSVDAYYRFNFNNTKDLRDDAGNRSFYNNATSFTNSHNSFELGMASVKFDYNTGKVGVVADLGFGRRAEEFSYNESGTLAAVKQAYLTYSASDKLKFTFGKFGTHVGYELLDPQLNRNYSMSYMFSYGPFFHTGLKADITISDNFGFMVGVANPTDYLSASFEKKFILAQVHAMFAEGKVATYLNYVGGEDIAGIKSNQIDAVITGKVSDKFSLGYNGTIKLTDYNDQSDSWFGSALYINVDPTPKFGLTLRGEYFDDKDNIAGVGDQIIATTLSFNIKPASNLIIMPEFRLDSAKDPYFIKNSGEGTKSSASFLLAAIVSF
ncbi:MAG: porin [Chitinophagaceae bacterium]|nr:porin [Chitinophagaceae bacterium]